MELIFLGTSAGIPTTERNVTGLGVKARHSRHWCLVDCGEATQHQLLRTPLSLKQLQAIFITHIHGDHCYGLPGLLCSAGRTGRTQPLHIIAPKGIKEFVTATLANTDADIDYELIFIAVESLGDTSMAINGFNVSATLLSHRVPSYAYSLSHQSSKPAIDAEKLLKAGVPKGPLWGQLQAGDAVTLADGRVLQPQDYCHPPALPQTVIVAGDNDRPELLAQAAGCAAVLVHEATYTEKVSQKVGPAPQHCSAQNIAAFAQRCGLKNLVLTHFSARYQGPFPSRKSTGTACISDIETEARNHYKGTLFLANDLDHFALNADDVLEKIKGSVS